MERADLIQQGIGPAEAREDDEVRHQTPERPERTLIVSPRE
jgi:hypothetical protein